MSCGKCGTQDVNYQQPAPDPEKSCGNCKNFKPEPEGGQGDCFGHKVSTNGTCNFFEVKQVPLHQ